MTTKRDPSMLLQLGFIGLLVISFAQASYWIYDHVDHTEDVRRQLRELYQAEAQSVTALFAGASAETIASLLPHLEVDAQNGRTIVSASALAALDREADTRINRFIWEGGFFLAVLLGGLTVMTRTIRHDAELRRRQQNFLAAVSHEFKSPLASIRLAAETMVLRAKENDHKRLGRRILEDDERLLRMVENLLDTNRLEEGGVSLSPVETSIESAGASAIAAVSEQARHHGISITTDIDPGLCVSADSAAVESILRNLLDNAVNACIAGHGSRVELLAARRDGVIEVEVRDDGAGFPPDEADMIFEKFYRAGDEIRRTTPGSGLGLYIVRRLLELSGASIRAQSPGSGQGAIFTMQWPDDAPE